MHDNIPKPLCWKLMVNNTVIQQVIEIKYVGVTLTSSGATNKEID